VLLLKQRLQRGEVEGANWPPERGPGGGADEEAVQAAHRLSGGTTGER